MRILVVGGTGVLGRSAVPGLIAAGHDVTVVARSNASASRVVEAGATAVRLDVWDRSAVGPAVAGHDAVINLTTAIPPSRRALLPGAWRRNDRIRSRLSGLLVDAALAGGVTRLIQESIALTYEDGGDRWLDEDAPVAAVDQTVSALDAEVNCARFAASRGRVGVTLRFGLLLDPGTTGAEMIGLAREGRLPLFGRDDAYISLLHSADAGRAIVAALEAPTGLYNVVEDEPETRGRHAAVVGGILGRTVTTMPSALARVPRLRVLARSQRIANRRFREASGWTPSWGSDRGGWSELVRELEAAAH